MVASLAIAASAVAGFDFKGDPLGMTLPEYVRKYDRLTKDSGRRAPNVIFRTYGKESIILRKFAMIRGEKFFGFEERDGPKETVAGIPARVSYTFYAASLRDWDLATAPRREQEEALDKIGFDQQTMNDRLKFMNARAWTEEELTAANRVVLGSMEMRFPKGYFLQVLGALTEKYGPPAVSIVEAKQNAMGATFMTRVVKWASEEDEIEMSELSYDIETTSLEFRRPSVLARANEAAKAERQKEAKDL